MGRVFQFVCWFVRFVSLVLFIYVYNALLTIFFCEMNGVTLATFSFNHFAFQHVSFLVDIISNTNARDVATPYLTILFVCCLICKGLLLSQHVRLTILFCSMFRFSRTLSQTQDARVVATPCSVLIYNGNSRKPLVYPWKCNTNKKTATK